MTLSHDVGQGEDPAEPNVVSEPAKLEYAKEGMPLFSMKVRRRLGQAGIAFGIIIFVFIGYHIWLDYQFRTNSKRLYSDNAEEVRQGIAFFCNYYKKHPPEHWTDFKFTLGVGNFNIGTKAIGPHWIWGTDRPNTPKLLGSVGQNRKWHFSTISHTKFLELLSAKEKADGGGRTKNPSMSKPSTNPSR